jgi:predicted permease
VLGRTLRINDADYAVVGVMRSDFRFPYSLQRIWLPFDFRHPPANLAAGFVTLTARLRPDVTPAHLTSEVKAAGPAMAAAASRPWKLGATTHFLNAVLIDSQTRRSIWLLFGATVLLMVTVCANVANLGLSQVFSRARDVAIRTALGASRGRLIRQTLIEQLAIGVLALVIAVPLTTAALGLAGSLLPRSYTFGSLNPIDIDWRLLAMMSALGIAAPLLAGLVPAVTGSRPSVLGALKRESRSVAGSKAARRLRQALVILEVTSSVVLLISASLLVRSFMRLQSADVGFESRNLVSVSLGFPTAHFGDPVSRELYLTQARESLHGVPGVTAATAASGVPPENGGISFGDVFTDADATHATDVTASDYEVQPDFFRVMGIAIRNGRALVSTDSREQIVISEGLAGKLFPGQSAVGHRIRWDDSTTWQEIVGVVATVHESTGSQPLPQVYSLLQPRTSSPVRPGEAIAEYARLAVRVADPVSTIPLIRNALKAVNPGVLVQSVDRVEDLLGKDLDRPRFLLALMLVFAVAGLLLAAAGVYGVLSCLVAEQLREYGIRLMLGASPTAISRAILIGGMGTTGAGLMLGFAIAAALGSTINSVLFEVQPHDLTSYVAVAAVLMTAAVAAAWRPARRARRVDPAVLLRNE